MIKFAVEILKNIMGILIEWESGGEDEEITKTNLSIHMTGILEIFFDKCSRIRRPSRRLLPTIMFKQFHFRTEKSCQQNYFLLYIDKYANRSSKLQMFKTLASSEMIFNDIHTCLIENGFNNS